MPKSIRRYTAASFLATFVAATFWGGPTFAAEPVLEMKAKDWKYLDTGKEPAEDWASVDFSDDEWKSGQAPLGYGDALIKQKISYGDDERNKHTVYYFRHEFTVDGTSAAKKFHAQFVCDDGCAIFLNGKEVHRYNLPKGKLTPKTNAPMISQGDIETHKLNFVIDADKMSVGKNVIAARVHQRGRGSSDLAFDFSASPLDNEAAVEQVEAAIETDKKLIKKTAELMGQSQQRRGAEGAQRPSRPERPERPSRPE